MNYSAKKRSVEESDSSPEKKPKLSIKKSVNDKTDDKRKFDKKKVLDDDNKNGKNNNNNNNTNNNNTEKVDWAKFKKDKKELKLKRKRTDTNIFEITTEAKKLYEKLKCKETKNKDVLSKELHLLFKKGDANIYEKLVVAHDTARIVQCLLKYASPDIRQEISENLINHIVFMSKSKYAHFCVKRMLKFGSPDIKNKIINSMFGNIISMLNNTYSSDIIDTIYMSLASSLQKSYMRQEFYGDLYKMSKDSKVKCISDTYKNSEQMKIAVHNSVKANLIRVANKKFFDNSLVHAVLCDYLSICSEADRTEIITEYLPFIPSLISTKDGTRASIICFCYSIVKDRRAIVKNLKEHLIKLCLHEHGHVLILSIINSMDDTKGIKKAIFDNIINSIELIVSNEYGRKVIQWFVAPEDTKLFHPQLIKYLDESLILSKKDKNVRRAEIIESIEEPLCTSIANNVVFWLRGGHTGRTTAAILSAITNSKLLQLVHNAMAECICNVEWKVPENEIALEDDNTLVTKIKKSTIKDEKPVIEKIKKIKKSPYDLTAAKSTENTTIDLVLGVEHAGLHMVLKKILKLDKQRSEKNLPTLCAAITEKLTKETLDIWLPLNRASFLLINIIENGPKDTVKLLKSLVKQQSTLLCEQSHVGSKLLLNNINKC